MHELYSRAPVCDLGALRCPHHGLFKCNRNTLSAMPRLHAYMRRILALEGITNMVNIDHIKAGYYSIKALNPTGIVPAGPSKI